MTNLDFADRVRAISAAARRHGLAVPGFRSPPRDRTKDRTIRRLADGSHIVAITIVDRSDQAVTKDIIEGVVAANGLTGDAVVDFWQQCSEAIGGF